MPTSLPASSCRVFFAALLFAAPAALLFRFPIHSFMPNPTEPKADAMDPGSELKYQMPGVLRLYKSGCIERFDSTDAVPPFPSGDPANGIASKDVVLDPATGIFARLYLPPVAAAEASKKLPVVVFFHGGTFVVHTAASPLYHMYAASLAVAAPAAAISVDYRLALEQRVPASYDDAFAALKAVVAACRLDGAEPWLTAHGDTSCIVLAEDQI